VADLPLDPPAESHLESCLACRRRIAAGRELLVLRRGQTRAAEPDWEAQRRAILERLPASPAAVVALAPRRRWRMVAAAAAVVAAVGLGVVTHRGSAPPAPDGEVPVEQILAEVEATLDGPRYPGFEPLESIVPETDELEAVYTNGTS
jgi:hypothetical protein